MLADNESKITYGKWLIYPPYAHFTEDGTFPSQVGNGNIGVRTSSY